MTAAPSIPDQHVRDEAIAERSRNLVVDAGAGTGKTRLLVERLVAMVAPEQPNATPLQLDRIAAVTFTRKAAGELRLRIREQLLHLLSTERDGRRRAQLQGALGALDTTHVGTIHSFADRLLRLRPMQARLSPGFTIAEDTEALERETLDRLLRGAETGRLEDEVGPERYAELEPRADEVEETLRLAMDAGIRTLDVDKQWAIEFGLQGIVSALLHQRDLPAPEAELAPFDRALLSSLVTEVRAALDDLSGASSGTASLKRLGRELESTFGRDRSVAETFREANALVTGFVGRGDLQMGKDFDKHKHDWTIYKRLTRDNGAILERMKGYLHGWLASRLVRMAPVARAVYEQVKARHRQVDQVDLLIRLRDMLRDDHEARAFYQERFDHLFIDEFQDTDPLQAEILMYLCEDGAACTHYREARLRPGKLTIVGDPKQSIYRFRRADVGMYDEVRRLIVEQGAHEAELETNFRSTPALIRWVNHRMDAVLGRGEGGRRFDAETGHVFQQPLSAGREGRAPGGGEGAAVHAVPYPAEGKADQVRAQEAEVMARYLRWLVTQSGLLVDDPVTEVPRPVGYGDVAVLAAATSHLHRLFAALDAEHIPHASRGGTLLLADPLHRRFLLGLRALSDRDDGIAQAALLRPPFFALDPRDLALAEAAWRVERGKAPDDGWDPDHPEVRDARERVKEARELVAELRKGRAARGVEHTARDLLERTAFARHLARGPNGAQRLARLRELCFTLGHLAESEGLGFDQVTARARQWIDTPVSLDPPHPVGAGAVQVLTVHQAKGLEFPVVVLWDGRGEFKRRKGNYNAALRQDRDGRAWHLRIGGCEHESPQDFGLKDREHAYENAELPRLVYVATTRARDLLVVPKPDPEPNARYICGALLSDAPEGTVHALASYEADARSTDSEPSWWSLPAPGPANAPGFPDASEPDRHAEWTQAASGAAAPRHAPIAVTTAAQEAAAEHPPLADPSENEPEIRHKWHKTGRYGATFGITVHRALELLLSGRMTDATAAVDRAAQQAGLTAHFQEAQADVQRTMQTLADLGIEPDNGALIRTEYPVAGQGEDGQLLIGTIDLLAQVGDDVYLIDFKTDEPPEGRLEQTHGAYVHQMRAYVGMLGRTRRTSTCGSLLFSADGSIHGVRGAGG